MYDSITAADIPADAQLVAGYVDGLYRWSDADWARFPGAVKVPIAIFASTNDGLVLDIEAGAASPNQAPNWVQRRRAAGFDPSCYVNLGNWSQVRQSFAGAGVAEPYYWLAYYDGVAVVPPGTVAKQYANPALIGAHYDLSAVLDYWPGVDPLPPDPGPPLPAEIVNDRSQAMLVSFYANFQHLFYVDAAGALQHLYQPPGGFPAPDSSWHLEAVSGASGLPPGGLVSGDQYYDQQHLYVERADGKVLHAWQSLHGVPDFAWHTELLPVA